MAKNPQPGRLGHKTLMPEASAMRGDIDPEKEAEALREWQRLKRGERDGWFKLYLPYLGMSQPSWYRRLEYLERNAPRKTPTTKGVRKNERLEHWVRWIMRTKYAPPAGWDCMTTKDAHLYCLSNDLIPPEAAALPEGTINRVARELRLYPMSEREPRFQGLFPGQLHQFDASTSKHFYPVRQEGGEWILKLRRRLGKNRDKEAHQRVWIYGLVDDFSRVRLSRYVVAPGESSAGGADFLRWAWCQSPEHEPICGIPEILYMDQGPLAKSKPFQDFCRGVPVELKAHRPYRSQATGKVENRWRWTWKRFETQFGVSTDWQEREITLGELNRKLFAFIGRMNQQRHPYVEMKILDVWLQGVKEMGGVVEIDPKSFDTVGQRFSKKLDGAGCFDFSFRGQRVWQVKGLHSCEVWVYQLLLEGGKLLVKDPKDGKSYWPAAFTAPMPVGTYIGQPKTELDKLRDDPAYALPPATREDFETELDNVLYLPPRTKEVRGGAAEIPPRPPLSKGEESWEDLAAGVEVVAGEDARPTEPLFASPWERYQHLLRREGAGQELGEADVAFMAWFEAEHGETLAMLGMAKRQLSVITGQ